MTLALGLCLCSLLCICGNTQFSGTLLWKILSCSSYSLSPSANIQLHQDLFLAMTIPFEIFCQPYILAEVYLSIGNGIFCDCSQVWVWLFSAIKKKKKKFFQARKGSFSFKSYLLCKHDKRLNGWECTEAAQIHPLTSELNWLSCSNLIFAGKIHFSIPQRRKLMRPNELRNYFLNDFSQVMYSKSGSFLFNTYFWGQFEEWGQTREHFCFKK